MKARLMFVGAIALAVPGYAAAANRPQLTLLSNPPGATIVEKDGAAAPQISPAAFAYAREKDGPDCLTMRAFTAYWPSGASATVEGISLCGKPKYFEFTLVRPADAPNAGVDYQNAANIQAVRQAAQQARTDNAMAALLLAGPIAQSMRTPLAPSQRQAELIGQSVSGSQRICTYHIPTGNVQSVVSLGQACPAAVVY